MKARDPKDSLGKAEVGRLKFNSSVIHDVEIKYPSSVNYRHSLIALVINVSITIEFLALTVNKIVKGTVNYSFNDVKAQSTGKKSFIGFMKS